MRAESPPTATSCDPSQVTPRRLSLPLGWLMSRVLIEVINRRSFGWSIETHLPAAALPEAVLLALSAALLAGLYPAWRMRRVQPAQALREE